MNLFYLLSCFLIHLCFPNVGFSIRLGKSGSLLDSNKKDILSQKQPSPYFTTQIRNDSNIIYIAIDNQNDSVDHTLYIRETDDSFINNYSSKLLNFFYSVPQFTSDTWNKTFSYFSHWVHQNETLIFPQDIVFSHESEFLMPDGTSNYNPSNDFYRFLTNAPLENPKNILTLSFLSYTLSATGRIENGKIFSSIFENEHIILVTSFNPTTYGDLLLFFKQPVRYIWELSSESVSELTRMLPIISSVMMQTLQLDGLKIVQNNGASAGQKFPHLHIELLGQRNWNWLYLKQVWNKVRSTIFFGQPNMLLLIQEIQNGLNKMQSLNKT